MTARFSERGAAYLRDHAIDPAFAEAFVREEDGALLWRYRDLDGSEYVRRRPLDGDRTFQPPGRALSVYWPLAVPEVAEVVLVCEGEPDALAALAVVGGTEGDKTARRALRRYEPKVAGLPGVPFAHNGKLVDALLAVGAREVFLALDGDEAGRKATAAAAESLRAAGMHVRDLALSGGLDLADCLVNAPDRATWLVNAMFDATTVEEDRQAEEAHAGDPERFDAAGVAEIRRALLDDAQDTRDAGSVVREEVPGTGGLLHRGVAAVFFSEREQGKSTVAAACAMSAAATGEHVLYLDYENGAALTKARLDAILAAHAEWGDPLAEERFVGRHYPELRRWPAADFAEAIAGLGFAVVVYDSLREFLARLGLDPDREADVSVFFARAVTPLLQRGVAVALLDNVGHENTHRPKGSGTKLDAAQQAYKVETTSRFSADEEGRIAITCIRSRYGDRDREWTMRVGGGQFEAPQAHEESGPARRARRAREGQEEFRLAVVAVLQEQGALGRDPLIKAARERGIKGRDEKLRNWLADLAAHPTSGIVKDEAGYALEGGGPEGPAQVRPTPADGHSWAPGPPRRGDQGNGPLGPNQRDQGRTEEAV